mmetsp:Transcript_8141/g.17222  ORF Transcript_8141/g.17222 Transcript_8141/m.17222 type:complete len:80 (-) Transcript_8141:150-389(-)
MEQGYGHSFPECPAEGDLKTLLLTEQGDEGSDEYSDLFVELAMLVVWCTSNYFVEIPDPSAPLPITSAEQGMMENYFIF